MNNDPVNPPGDNELMANALNLWANYIETGSVNLSAKDAQQAGKPFRALDEHQMALVVRLREMAWLAAQRSGNGIPPYTDLEAIVKTMPMTWYPALLAEMVMAAMRKKVFKSGRVAAYVKQIEDKQMAKRG